MAVGDSGDLSKDKRWWPRRSAGGLRARVLRWRVRATEEERGRESEWGGGRKTKPPDPTIRRVRIERLSIDRRKPWLVDWRISVPIFF